MIPDSVKQNISDRLNATISSIKLLSGGDINRAAKLTTNRGSLFVKWNNNAPADMFEKEAKGLELLRSADSEIVVPEVLVHQAPGSNNPGFLVMEYIEPAGGSVNDSYRFGEQLAKLHQTSSDRFGLDHNNYIGRLPQSNSNHSEWISFFTEERIKPQLKMALDSGKIPVSINGNSERFFAKLDEIFPSCKPSLLHGDLWSGNYFFDSPGNAVLIDPAVYFGHPEVDLAFSKMFGGFSAEFYRGYESISPLEPGFENRIPVYNLYPLLVHVNLFGSGYAMQARRFLEKF